MIEFYCERGGLSNQTRVYIRYICMTMRSILCRNINMHKSKEYRYPRLIDIHFSDAGIQLT